jgi:hypothetical protein
VAVAAARQWQDQCGWVDPIVLTLVAVLACVGDGLILPQEGDPATLLEITVTGKNPHGRFAASDNGDGSYTASYTPNTKGKDSITITLDGAPIGGSPYTSDVH